jgi:hypothetical protein
MQKTPENPPRCHVPLIGQTPTRELAEKYIKVYLEVKKKNYEKSGGYFRSEMQIVVLICIASLPLAPLNICIPREGGNFPPMLKKYISSQHTFGIGNACMLSNIDKEFTRTLCNV